MGNYKDNRVKSSDGYAEIETSQAASKAKKGSYRSPRAEAVKLKNKELTALKKEEAKWR